MALILELAHPVLLVTDDQGYYRAECGCGWVSDWSYCDDATAEGCWRRPHRDR
jgi:hypothetical protein